MKISDETKWKKTKYKSLSYGTTLLRVLGKHAPDDYGRIKSGETMGFSLSPNGFMKERWKRDRVGKRGRNIFQLINLAWLVLRAERLSAHF